MKEGNLFDFWNTIKKERDAQLPHTFFRVREVWYCAVGLNIGYEQDGKHRNFERPVLIIKKLGKYLFFGVPLTSRKPKNYFEISIKLFGNRSTVVLSQLRVYDSRRLLRKVGRLSYEDFQIIRSWFVECFK